MSTISITIVIVLALIGASLGLWVAYWALAIKALYYLATLLSVCAGCGVAFIAVWLFVWASGQK